MNRETALPPGEEAVRSRAGSGMRIALICAVWAGALWAGSIAAFGDLCTSDFCGFLPDLVVFLVGLAQLVVLSVLLWTAGRCRRMARWAGMVVAATVVLFAAKAGYAPLAGSAE